MKKFAVVCLLALSSSMVLVPLLDTYHLINHTLNSIQVRISGESMVDYIDEGLVDLLNLDELKETAQIAD